MTEGDSDRGSGILDIAHRISNHPIANMPWRPLPRIAVAIAIYPFAASSPADLPLEIGDDLYIIEQGGKDGEWFRGYLVAPPSLLAGLTCVKGQTLEARVFSGIFPRCCVEIREHLGDTLPNGHTNGDLTNGDGPMLEQVNGDSPFRRKSLAYKPGIQRRNSNDSEKLLNPSMNGDLSPESPASKRLATQTLARKLSHRSITSSRSRNSLVPTLPATPTTELARDPHAKRPQAPVPMLKIGDETPTSAAEPLVDEIASCLREWHSKNLHELLLARRYLTLEKLSDLVNRLNIARRQLLHGVLTDQELINLREETVWDLVGGNKMLSNEVIVRDPTQRGRLLTGDDSPIELSKLQSTMSLLDRPPSFQHDPINMHHLMVELKAFGHSGLISPSISLQLYGQVPGQSAKAISECFAVDIPTNEDFERLSSTGNLRTLFIDLTASDIGAATKAGNALYLVIRVQSSHAIQEVMNRRDENVTFSRPALTNTPSGPSPMKGGRQSLMWAQKQFGSVRNRNHAPRPSRLAHSTEETFPRETGSRPATGTGRPTTGDSSRPATQQGTQYVKKRIGAGVINLKPFFGHSTITDQRVSIWAPASTFLDPQEPTDDHWDELIRDLVSSKNGVYAKAKSIEHVRLGIQTFDHPDARELISKTPTLLQNATPTPKVVFSGTPTKPRSDIYVTISEADLPHHALLSHPERGSVQIHSSLELKNVQLTLEVRKSNGQRIDRCIFPNSNGPGQTAWRTVAAPRREPWSQLIKLVIPTADVPEAHLIMSIADAPGFPFALSWIPLWTEGAFIRDGKHAPLLYLYDKVTSGTDNGRGAYLAYPWDSKSRDGSERDENVTGPIATLKLETNLCSTYFSQDKILLGILNWRQQPGNMILDILTKFAFVPEIEIVKMIGNVFDALFGILGAHSGKDQFEDAVFNALVTVLGIVYDRRFNLGPFVDDYAETKFDHPHAASCLIRSYLRLLANPSDPSQSRRLRATFKVGRQILKFILCAREKQGLQEAVVGTTTQSAFKRDLKTIFDSFEKLMRDPAPILIGSKTLVVQHMPTWLPALKESNAFSEEQILGAATSFIESCADVQGKLLLYKLVLILNLTNTDLFSQPGVRQKVVRLTPRWINPCWGFNTDLNEQWREQIRLCCSIVAKNIAEPGFQGSDYLGKTIQAYNALLLSSDDPKDSLSLLFPTNYPFPAKPVTGKFAFDESRTELAAVLAKLTRTPFITSASSPILETTGMVSATLEVVMSILSGGAFPESWLSLYVYHHKSMLQILENLFNVMVTSLVPSPDDADSFNTDLWNKFLTTLLTLVRSDTLALETFPEQKRRAVWKVAGDVREQGASLLRRSWEAIGWDTNPEEQQRYGLQRLGGFQVQYVPKLVAPIVELCLSVHEGLRSVAVRILQAMIISEWTLNEDLSVVQAEMIDSLDLLFKTKNFGESMVQKMFVNELLDSFEQLARMPLDPLWQAVRDMVSTIDELLELLASVNSPNITENLRIMNTLQLMSFLKDMQKEDIFIRYVHQLAGVQARLGNKTEAGLALALHAEQYAWDSERVEALSDPKYPEQTSFERKEQLYFEMVGYFEEGAAWDSALESYRELANQYELSHYDFAKLARTQRSMATIYETISKGEWQPPRYFRVTYQGMGFPSNLRDRQFIYEGEPSERQAAFTDRMRQLHPAAQIIHKGEVDDSDSDGQYLQVSPVSTYRDLTHAIHQQPKVAQATRDYITGSKPYRFAVTSKRHSPTPEVANQWIEKTLYITREAFPTILRRSEIVAIDIIRLTPLQTAVERTSRKTAELVALEKRVIAGDEAGYSPLTEAITSSVEPSSAATVAQYRQLLPQRTEANEDDEEEEPTEPAVTPMQNALQIALLDHVSALKHSLAHFSRSHHQRTQDTLSQSLYITFAPEMALLAPKAVAEADTVHQLLSSPSRTSIDMPTSTTSPTITSGPTLHATNPDQTTISDPRPRTLNRLSFNMLKGSFGSNANSTPAPEARSGKAHIAQQLQLMHQTNGSAPSDDGSSSAANSHRAPHNTSGHHSNTADMTAHTAGNGREERPVTSQSATSSGTGRVKKRLSLLSMGMGRSGSGSRSREGGNGSGSGLGADVIRE